MKTLKKNAFLILTLFLVFFIGSIFSFGVQAAVPVKNDNNVDYIAIYKAFFSNLKEKNYALVWNSTAYESKMQIATMISKETKGKATAEEVFNMLATDENQVRTIFFDEFLKETGGLMTTIIKDGKFTLKSVSPDKAVVNIDFNNEPRDFEILKESGSWKINFFADLFK